MIKEFIMRYIAKNNAAQPKFVSRSPKFGVQTGQYDLASLREQAKINKSIQQPISIRINSEAVEDIGLVYEALPISHSTTSSNSPVSQSNVVALPEAMDAETEKLLQRFIFQERQQPFIKEQNKLLKYYLNEVKLIRDDLTLCRAEVEQLLRQPKVDLIRLDNLKNRMLEHRQVLRELSQHFQTDKTRLIAKQEVYRPILHLVERYHPRRTSHLSHDVTQFVHKQCVLLEKMSQCYDKLIIAVSGFLGRIEVQVQTVREVLLPKREQELDELIESCLHKPKFDGANCQDQQDWNLIELRKFVAEEGVLQ